MVCIEKKTMLFICSLVSMLSFCENLTCQNWDWVTTIRPGGNIYVEDIEFDEVTNSILSTGRLRSSAIFGLVDTLRQAPTALGYLDTFTAAYETNGNLKWVKREGSTNGEWGFGVTSDSDGNVISVGIYSDTASFSGVVPMPMFNDRVGIYLTKYDSLGNLLWLNYAKSEDGVMYGYNVCTDKMDNIYITGFIEQGQAIFSSNDTIGTPSDIYRAYVAKYSKQGELLWVIDDFDVTGRSIGLDIVFNHVDNNVYVAGNSNVRTSNGQFFLAKIDSLGNVLWVQESGGAESEIGYGITVDHLGNLYVCGEYTGNLNLSGSSIPEAIHKSAYVAKVDTQANLVWLKQIGFNDSTFSLKDIEFLDEEHIGFCGFFRGKAGFGSDEIVALGNSDGFFGEMTLDGDPLWIKAIGGKPLVTNSSGKYADTAESIAYDKDQNIYVGGWYIDTVYFDDILRISGNGQDGFIGKVFPPIEGDLFVEKDTICIGERIFVKGMGRGSSLSYEWDFSNFSEFQIDNNEAQVSFTTPGKYDISLIISNPYDSDTVFLNTPIVVKELPFFSLGSDTTICEGSHLVLSGIDGIDFQYLWSDSSMNLDHIVTESGNYSLTVTDNFGCSYSDDIFISVETCTSTENPVSFGVKLFPNPIGAKESLNIYIPDIGIGACNFICFDLNGKVHSSSELRPGLNKVNTENLPKGIHFYKISNELEFNLIGKLLKQ